ncbi:MAG: signal peptidase I [Lachnospiraceae bacterium]|nr:signal peptidase I [Lachnospiraceae bacterium]
MKTQKNNIFNHIFKYISQFFFIICIVLIFALGVVRLIGLNPYVITSGSMVPKYKVGSIVYIQKVNPEELKVGDDISFYLDDKVVATHRIREIDEQNRQVKTYGIHNKDSNGNQINDANPVDFDHIIGKVKFSLPILGYIYLFARTTTGKAIIITLLAMVLISSTIHYIYKRRRDYGEKTDKS